MMSIRGFWGARLGFVLITTAAAAPLESGELDGAAPASDSEPSAVEESRRLFRLASGEARAGKWREALGYYEEAFARYEHATTVYNIGYCHAELGDGLAAWIAITRALDPTSFDEGRRLSPERAAEAQRLKEQLRRELSTIRLEPMAHKIKIRVDDRSLAPLRDGEATVYVPRQDAAGDEPEIDSPIEIRVDAGRHQVSLISNERGETRLLELAAEEEAVLRWPERAERTHREPVQRQDASSSTPRSSRGGEPATPGVSTTPSPATAPSRFQVAGITSLGLGGIGFGTAAVSAILASNTARRLNEVCDSSGRCPPENRSEVESYTTSMRLLNAGLLLGVIGTGVGAGLLFWDAYGSDQTTVQIGWSPTEIQVSGRF